MQQPASHRGSGGTQFARWAKSDCAGQAPAVRSTKAVVLSRKSGAPYDIRSRACACGCSKTTICVLGEKKRCTTHCIPGNGFFVRAQRMMSLAQSTFQPRTTGCLCSPALSRPDPSLCLCAGLLFPKFAPCRWQAHRLAWAQPGRSPAFAWVTSGFGSWVSQWRFYNPS